MIPRRKLMNRLLIIISCTKSFPSQWLHQECWLSRHWSAQLSFSCRQSAFTKYVVRYVFINIFPQMNKSFNLNLLISCSQSHKTTNLTKISHNLTEICNYKCKFLHDDSLQVKLIKYTSFHDNLIIIIHNCSQHVNLAFQLQHLNTAAAAAALGFGLTGLYSLACILWTS